MNRAGKWAIGRRCNADTESETVARKCLKCEREFQAFGRFQRLCSGCHKSNEGLSRAETQTKPKSTGGVKGLS